jgi:DNA-binding MarR family transcriptional regulator
MSVSSTAVYNAVESLARMNKQELDLFYNDLVDRYPDLADKLSTHVEYLLQDRALSELNMFYNENQGD